MSSVVVDDPKTGLQDYSVVEWIPSGDPLCYFTLEWLWSCHGYPWLATRPKGARVSRLVDLETPGRLTAFCEVASHLGTLFPVCVANSDTWTDCVCGTKDAEVVGYVRVQLNDKLPYRFHLVWVNARDVDPRILDEGVYQQLLSLLTTTTSEEIVAVKRSLMTPSCRTRQTRRTRRTRRKKPPSLDLTEARKGVDFNTEFEKLTGRPASAPGLTSQAVDRLFTKTHRLDA